jgi:hypothetical protein
LDKALFFPIFVSNVKSGIMEEDNLNKAQGRKGTFPGENPADKSAYSELQGIEPGVEGPEEELKSDENVARVYSDANTYMRLETKTADGQTAGVFEIDLISFREKGQESRYLSVNTLGTSQEGESSNTVISINNEADFNKFKEFISNLNWND